MYFPEKDYDIPSIDLLTLIFDSPLAECSEETIVHVEAANPSNCITKAQHRTLTKRLIYILRDQFDIGKNGPNKDVVVCMTSGQVLAPSLFFGIVGAGGIYSGASTAFTVSELARQIKQGAATLIIISEEFRDVALKAAKECSIGAERVLVLQSNGGARILKDLAGSGKNYLDERRELEWERITDRKALETSLICLLYSSGTTGVPKGVNLSHWTMVNETLIHQLQEKEHETELRRKDPSHQSKFSAIAHLPIAHIVGVHCYFVMGSLAGGPIYWMPKFDFPLFLEYSKKFSITCLFTVPPIYLLIVKSPAVKNHFKDICKAVSLAAPLGEELQIQAGKKIGVDVTQIWGLTETNGLVTGTPSGRQDVVGSVGLLAPNSRIRIVDEDGKDVAKGEAGELLLKGPAVTKGYHKNPEATKRAFTSDGWFKTGDIGMCKDGYFYIVDRKKEMIKYNGLQVAPAEIEALLLSHDLILDAAVIGIPDPSNSVNEVPRAYVVADRAKISSQEIQDFVKTNLASHKQLRGGVIYVESIPKSPSGKILRREIRDAVHKTIHEGKPKL